MSVTAQAAARSIIEAEERRVDAGVGDVTVPTPTANRFRVCSSNAERFPRNAEDDIPLVG